MTDVTLVTTIKNRDKDTTIRYLESVKRQTYPCEVIVVDFGSSQKNLSWERKLFAKYGVNFIVAKNELELFRNARAVNIGWKRAKTLYVIETNIDLILSKNLVEETMKVLKSEDTAFVLCQRKDISRDGKTTNLHSRAAVGAFIGVKKSWIDKVRGADETFFLWGGWDLDLADRARRNGRKIFWVSDIADVSLSHVWHPPALKPQNNENEKYRKIPNKPIVRNLEKWGEI